MNKMTTKIIVSLLLMFISCYACSKAYYDSLNGKIFEGRATEITPPDVDRMPMVHTEVIRFENGVIHSKVLNIYGVESCAYTSQLDDRRAVAMNVMTFNTNSQGVFDGRNFNAVFTGEVMGDKTLSGTLTIHFSDNTDVKYLIEAVSIN